MDYLEFSHGVVQSLDFPHHVHKAACLLQTLLMPVQQLQQSFPLLQDATFLLTDSFFVMEVLGIQLIRHLSQALETFLL
jgi:hypothetical protein